MAYSIQDFGLHHVTEPLPIFTIILKDHIKLNEYLKQVILDYRERYPQTSNSNVKAWHSSYFTHELTNKFNPLIDEVVNACSFISKEYYGEGNVEFAVFNLWAMMYEKSEYTVRHRHYPADFSVTYYVDVEPDCAPIVFDTLTITPKSGMLVIWQALLHHEVPPTNSRRTVIAMNIANKHKMNYE